MPSPNTEPGAGTSDQYAHLITSIALYPTNATAKDTTTTGGVVTLVGNVFFYLTPERTTPAVFRGLEAASRKGTVVNLDHYTHSDGRRQGRME